VTQIERKNACSLKLHEEFETIELDDGSQWSVELGDNGVKPCLT